MKKNIKKYAEKIRKKIKKLKGKKINKNYIEQINSRRAEIQLMLDEINVKQQKRKKIQQDFKFEIPGYVLDGIIEYKEKKSTLNQLIALINLAILNGGLSKENGKVLKSTCKIKENNV